MHCCVAFIIVVVVVVFVVFVVVAADVASAGNFTVIINVHYKSDYKDISQTFLLIFLSHTLLKNMIKYLDNYSPEISSISLRFFS